MAMKGTDGDDGRYLAMERHTVHCMGGERYGQVGYIVWKGKIGKGDSVHN